MPKRDGEPEGLTTNDVPFLADGEQPTEPPPVGPEPTVLTPGYEEAVAEGVDGGVAPASECTFPGCGNPRVEQSYMCAEHTAAHEAAEAERRPEDMTE